MVLLAVRAAPFHEPQRHETDAPRQGGIGFSPVEPVARSVFVAGRRGVGPDEYGEHDRGNDEQRHAAPDACAAELVERHEGEHDEQPDRPDHRVGCLI